ncbi:MAG: sigma-70 family RNA polymerase sigma factor [Acidobacteria bacterium]|nr:sigma-70 family RNA polymerase sigma factor [Acidobacteriota bacterium]
MALTDAELVARALAGSQDACRLLVARHSRVVFNLIARMVRDPGVAEELAQDSFVKAFGALRSFDPSYKFSNWLLRIAQNTAIDHLRRVRPETVSIDAEAPGQPIADLLVDERARSPLDRAEQRDLREALETALAGLRPDYRRLVVLRYLEDASYEDIAAMLDLPLGTVKSHLHRARAELARLMEDSGWAPDRDPADEVCNPGRGPARRTG